MVAVISVLMVVLIVGLGIRGYRLGNEEARRHLRIESSKRTVSPEARDLMRKAGYDV